MDKRKILKLDEIKFDDDNIFLARHINMYERILENLSTDEANIYLICLMFLENSVENNYANENNEIYGIFEIEDIIDLSPYELQETINIYTSLVDKNYIREEIKDGDSFKYFLY